MSPSAAPAFRVEALTDRHDRTAFSCGKEQLDRYFRNQISQDSRRHLATPFVLIEAASDTVAGYYTLSAEGVSLKDLPNALTKRLPRYPMLPATLLGRLAVDQRFQGRGVGKALMLDALRRAYLATASVASLLVLVDPIDDDARRFYGAYGFQPFEDRPDRLFLPMSVIAKLTGPASS